MRMDQAPRIKDFSICNSPFVFFSPLRAPPFTAVPL
jgi:hypothetical protein